MARARLVEQAVEGLLERIVTGEFAPGEPLPAQPVLAEELEVSRLTVREAVETLRSRGIVDVVHGSGTFVLPTRDWVDADAVSRLVGLDGHAETVSSQVIEVRRMVEVGAAELCAIRRTEADVAELERLLGDMRDTHAAGDIAGFVSADMAFHGVILRGCQNPFLPVVYEPLMRVLRRARRETSEVAIIRDHAIDHHGAILEAVRVGDGPAAREAMASHMAQTAGDLEAHVS